MAFVAQLLTPADLARLSEKDLGNIASALDGEILRNSTIREVLEAKVKTILKEIHK